MNASSVFGPSYETTLIVQDGNIVKRSLVISEVDNEGHVTPIESWSEAAGTLGSHNEGAELKTIDERYAACRAELEATNTARSDISVTYTAPTNAETTQDAVLASCLILPKNTVYDGGAEVVTSLEFLRNPNEQVALETSLETWKNLKAQNGDHYRYKTSFGSFSGFGDTTTLTVQGETVVSRAYEAYRVNGNTGEKNVTESWTEEGAEVGSHKAGAEPRTVDELYGVCRSDVLTQNPSANDFYLEFRDDGVLKTCDYVPKDCVDDCSRGVNITGLEFLAKLD